MLRLMTLNLNYRVAKHGPWEARRALIAETIKRAQADLVVLQAVECLDGRSQANELSEIVDYPHVTFVAAMTEGRKRQGSAFLSRRPLGDVEVRRLTRQPNHEDKSDRLLLRIQVKGAAGSFNVYNAHFSWVLPQALDNARETLDFNNRHPAILLGDLNSAPDSPAIETMRRGGWIDLWTALNANDPGYTFEADRPTMRIDYALASPEVRQCADSIQRLGEENGAPPRLSDHLGLLVTIRDEHLRAAYPERFGRG